MKAYLFRIADEPHDIMAIYTDRKRARNAWVRDYAGYMVNWESLEEVKAMLRAFHQAEIGEGSFDEYGECNGVLVNIMETDT